MLRFLLIDSYYRPFYCRLFIIDSLLLTSIVDFYCRLLFLSLYWWLLYCQLFCCRLFIVDSLLPSLFCLLFIIVSFLLTLYYRLFFGDLYCWLLCTKSTISENRKCKQKKVSEHGVSFGELIFFKSYLKT